MFVTTPFSSCHRQGNRLEQLQRCRQRAVLLLPLRRRRRAAAIPRCAGAQSAPDQSRRGPQERRGPLFPSSADAPAAAPGAAAPGAATSSATASVAVGRRPPSRRARIGAPELRAGLGGRRGPVGLLAVLPLPISVSVFARHGAPSPPLAARRDEVVVPPVLEVHAPEATSTDCSEEGQERPPRHELAEENGGYVLHTRP